MSTPNMYEVERLLDLYADHVFSDGLLSRKIPTEHAASARAALLDYVRGVMAEAGKDAERYRYLRNRDAQFVLTASGPEAGCFIDFEDESGTLVLLTGADADAEIDAAMRGEVKP